MKRPARRSPGESCAGVAGKKGAQHPPIRGLHSSRGPTPSATTDSDEVRALVRAAFAVRLAAVAEILTGAYVRDLSIWIKENFCQLHRTSAISTALVCSPLSPTSHFDKP